ncbi:DUF418 domain-containing protein [Sphingosinicella terrae]|uniref:DUF418 domain-containing protein n=1 Tax=Sphingosinicella terrae TaxID=2172047 RepID=UPI000E0D4D39|nr:DUF418 domain-containing protein [Sphingosinicella terrae]
MASIAAPGALAAPSHGPGPASDRIEALDFVRGVAVCGILLMNIIGFGLPEGHNSPAVAGGASGVNLWTWIITEMGFEGTQRALFSMLFGASVILLTSRLEASGRADATDIYFRRNLWLIAFGLVNAFIFLWYGDILYAYGIVGLFLFAFRRLAARWLIGLGVAALLLGIAWNVHDGSRVLAKHEAHEAAAAARDAGETLTPAQETALADWEATRTQYEPPPESARASTEARSGGYWRAFLHTAMINSVWQSWGLYRYFFDLFGMMLIGMGLFRAGVLTLERPTRLYVALLVIGYAIGLVVNYHETRLILDRQFAAEAFARASFTYDLGRLAMTLGHLAALLLFVRSGMLPLLRRAFAAVGQMAVTNYLAHSVVCLILFVGLGWYNQLERHQLYLVVLAIWTAQLVISPLWLSLFRFGPVEWLWRYLTYLDRPPFRRGTAIAAPAAIRPDAPRSQSAGILD